MTTPTVADVIGHLLNLRKILAHTLKQPNISPVRFNEVRAQLLPLDLELAKLGETDLPVIPEAAPTYVRPSRYQKRRHKRGTKFTERVMRKVGSIGK